MTAKEKAEKLVNRMQAQRYMSLGAATQCALICVDEILESTSKNLIQSIHFITYWQEVKEEINKL